MFTFLVVLHVIICVFLILVVLLQVGRGIGLSGLMGGGMESMLGASGGNTFLKKVTMGFAIGFLVNSLLLTIFASRLPVRSVMDGIPMPPPPPVASQPEIPVQEPSAGAPEVPAAAPQPAAQK